GKGRIQILDSASDERQEIHGILRRPNHPGYGKKPGALWRLFVWIVNRGHRFRVEAAGFGVAYHADDLHLWWIHELDVLSDRIRSTQKPPSKRPIHDDDARLTSAITVLNLASLDHRNA